MKIKWLMIIIILIMNDNMINKIMIINNDMY